MNSNDIYDDPDPPAASELVEAARILAWDVSRESLWERGLLQAEPGRPDTSNLAVTTSVAISLSVIAEQLAALREILERRAR